MTEAEQLQWFIDWRNRLLSAMRLWWKPSDYKAGCRAWTTITEILKEQPPTKGKTE